MSSPRTFSGILYLFAMIFSVASFSLTSRPPIFIGSGIVKLRQPLSSSGLARQAFTQLSMNRPPEKKISRQTEGDYFESEFDRKPLKERLPVALGFLGAVSLPFIVGLIYLYTNK